MKKEEKAINGSPSYIRDALKFLAAYIVSAGLLFVLRAFLHEYCAPFAFSAAFCCFTVFVALFFGKRAFCFSEQREIAKTSRTKAFAFSALVFASGVLISIPLLYLGDYISQSAGLFYDNSLLFGEGFWACTVFFVILPGVLMELVFRRAIKNLLGDRLKKPFLYLSRSLFFGLFFMDVTLFFAMLVMCGILDAVEAISKNKVLSTCCSVVFMGIVYFFSFMFSIDTDGVSNLGIVGILGMLFCFSSIALAILYVINKLIFKTKTSYVEAFTVILLDVLMFIAGCVMTSV